MLDIDILVWLSRPRTVLNHTYRVAWNCETSVAEVIRDEEEVVATFDRELDAHAYINDLSSLDQTKDKDAWRQM